MRIVQHYPGMAHMGLIMAAAMLVLASVACGDSPPASTLTLPDSTETIPARTVALPTRTPAAATAPSGALDQAFGDGGIVTTDLNGRSDEVHAVIVQPDGKIVVAGETYVFPQDRPRFALARYNSDGSLDATFGDSGQIITGMTDDEWDASVPHALALQPDGKLLVAGTSYSPDDEHNVFTLARFEADGAPDNTFGSQGRVLTAIDTSESAVDDVAYALAVGADGKIVLAGATGAFPTDFAAARYMPDGKLDTTFGDRGKVVTDLGGSDAAAAISIQPDGKVVLAGRGVENDDDWAMLRYMPGGQLDTAFGKGGKLSLDFNGGEDRATGLAIRPDGKIVVGGTIYVGAVICKDENGLTRGCDKYSSALAQYTPNGALDKTFAGGGKAVYDFDLPSGANALVLQPDGKVVLAGHYDGDDFAVMRANPDGTLDGTFGEAGLVRTPFGRSYDVAYALALQPDGKIVAAGTGTLSDNPLNGDFALTRYHGR